MGKGRAGDGGSNRVKQGGGCAVSPYFILPRRNERERYRYGHCRVDSSSIASSHLEAMQTMEKRHTDCREHQSKKLKVGVFCDKGSAQKTLQGYRIPVLRIETAGPPPLPDEAPAKGHSTRRRRPLLRGSSGVPLKRDWNAETREKYGVRIELTGLCAGIWSSYSVRTT